MNHRKNLKKTPVKDDTVSIGLSNSMEFSDPLMQRPMYGTSKFVSCLNSILAGEGCEQYKQKVFCDTDGSYNPQSTDLSDTSQQYDIGGSSSSFSNKGRGKPNGSMHLPEMRPTHAGIDQIGGGGASFNLGSPLVPSTLLQTQKKTSTGTVTTFVPLKTRYGMDTIKE